MLLALDERLLHELRRRAVEHVDVHVRHGPEAAPLDEDRLLVQHLGRLEDLAVLPEHDRVRQPELDEEERHQPVVDVLERRAREAEHVDLDPVAAEVVAEATRSASPRSLL